MRTYKAFLRFTLSYNFGNDYSYCKCNCVNILTKNRFRLKFSKGSALYNRIQEMAINQKEFYAYVSYDAIHLDNVREIKGKRLQEFIENNAEYFI